MISYPFISDLFTSILSKSKAIEGRFYVCPKMGTEINSDVLGQVLTDIKPPAKKYPLVLMMPPRSNGVFGYNNPEFVNYYITLFFLKTSYYGPGSNLNIKTATSMHSIQQDWHDMNRAATAFMQVLETLYRQNINLFRVSQREKMFNPVSSLGIDNASGVRLDFSLGIFSGCEPVEDYEPEDILLITVPVGDSHPEHAM